MSEAKHAHERQITLARSVSCSGIGLHTGKEIRMRIEPLEADAGLVFCREDLGAESASSYIKADFRNVCSTTLGTVLRNDEGASVSTVEHLCAALWGCGVDNALVTLDGPEVPIMDGSSEPFVFLLDCAGRRRLGAARKMLTVTKEVTVRDEKEGAYMTVRPASGFAVDMTIDFNDKVIRRQTRTCDFEVGSFKRDIARARTFGFARQVDMLRDSGLALGGSLENAVVVGEEGVLNKEELRYGDEFVRHKILDCVGDLFLSGASLRGRVEGYRSGHGLNNALLRKMFAEGACEWMKA